MNKETAMLIWQAFRLDGFPGYSESSREEWCEAIEVSQEDLGRFIALVDEAIEEKCEDE